MSKTEQERAADHAFATNRTRRIIFGDLFVDMWTASFITGDRDVCKELAIGFAERVLLDDSEPKSKSAHVPSFVWSAIESEIGHRISHNYPAEFRSRKMSRSLSDAEVAS